MYRYVPLKKINGTSVFLVITMVLPFVPYVPLGSAKSWRNFYEAVV
jgi:hypothetical protein